MYIICVDPLHLRSLLSFGEGQFCAKGVEGKKVQTKSSALLIIVMGSGTLSTKALIRH